MFRHGAPSAHPEASSTDPVTASPRQRRALGPAHLFLVVAGSLAALHATGVAGDLPMALLAVGTPTAIAIAIRTHRPRPAHPWWLLVGAGVLWATAAVIRDRVGATGDLTADRNVLPDVFAVAGYFTFALGLAGMVRARRTGTRGGTLALDAAIAAMAVFIAFWVVLVAPVLHTDGVADIAKAAIVIYPPISGFMVAIAARLAYDDHEHSWSGTFLLAGMIALLAGDVTYVPLEMGLFDPRWSGLLELPYAVAYTLIGAAALHPTMRSTVRVERGLPHTPRWRFGLTAAALMTPTLTLFAWTPANLLERYVVAVVACLLGLVAVARVTLAARTQAAVEEELATLATHDDLTDLPNRWAARDEIDRRLDDGRPHRAPMAVLFVDLDRFKLVNDSFGHLVGDQLLVAAARRLREAVGHHHMVARLSGDEFLVVLDGVEAEAAAALAASICQQFTEPFEIVGQLYVTASIGVATIDHVDETHDATTLIRDADTAMYEAKASGRSSYAVYNPDMRARTTRKFDLLNAMMAAVERDEFEVHYQPIVDPATRQIHGVEALARWCRDGELVPPSHFIEFAEETGLITPIGEAILRKACHQVARWRHLTGCEGLEVSVNVSARQLHDTDLVVVVAEVLDECGLEPDALWLELTESVMMDDSLDTLATMSGLRGLGVHLSVDDFGTGYSSLSYLQRYPIERVKIDRRFIRGVCDEPRDAAVVAAVIGIADALDLSLVAEGVETQEQADKIVQLRCDLAQGFLFGRPAPALDIGPVLVSGIDAVL